jgi:signal transduction histidine kinase
MSEPGGEKHWRRHRPPWWPADESWPPEGPPNVRAARALSRFVLKRVGCALTVLLMVLIFGALGLMWAAAGPHGGFAGHPGFWHGPGPGPWPLGGIGFILVVGGGLFLVARMLRRATEPVSDLLEGVSRVADGDYSQRVSERGPRRTRALARAFNEMAGRLQSTEQERRDLLADVTHELRTPITVIQGNLEGMLDGIYPADADHLEAILEETRVLSRVIEDLRTLSLAEGGTLKLQLQSTDLAELIEETAGAFQAQAAAAQVHLVVETAADLPLVEADPTRIHEVLANLVSNALRYTPAGGEIRLTGKLGEGQVYVSVEDSGKGIPAEDLPHIFDRFYKGRDSHGTGLGLAIAKSLIAAHHGEIRASSQPGQGTRIEFSLPTPL